MNLLRKFFHKAPEEGNNDCVSQHTGITPTQSSGDFDAIHPENIEAIVAVVPKGSPEPTLEGGRLAYVWLMWQQKNPEMFRAISKIGTEQLADITAIYYESEFFSSDGLIKPDHLLDFIKYTNIPREHSCYVQLLGIRNGPVGPRWIDLITVFATSKPLCVICDKPLVP